MTDDQAALILAQYAPDIDSTLHTGLGYVQAIEVVLVIGVLVALVGFLILCAQSRPTEQL